MCLAIPGKVIELKQKGKIAVVEFNEKERKELLNAAKAKKGEKVLVQQGMVVEKIK